MTFNPEIFRSILLQVESFPPEKVVSDEDIRIEHEPLAVVAEHVRLLAQSGFIEAKVLTAAHKFTGFFIYALEMKGHEFLRNARNDTVWKKVMGRAKEQGISLSMHLLNSALEKLAGKIIDIE